MKVNYEEYNQIHHKRASQLESFMMNLAQAIEKCGEDGKTSPKESMLHQLRCIGYSEEFVTDMCQVAQDYKAYHKERIRAEQIADLPETKYRYINPDRVHQYAKNRELITALLRHEAAALFLSDVAEVLENEAAEINVQAVLQAYLDGDVDQLITKLSTWNMEQLMMKAKVIPDEKEFFYKPGDFSVAEIAFPFYGKESISQEAFFGYLLGACDKFNEDTCTLVQGVVAFLKASGKDNQQIQDSLWAIIKDMGVPEAVVRLVNF